MNTNELNKTGGNESETTASDTFRGDSTPTTKRSRFSKTVPDVSPSLAKLIDSTQEYGKKVGKELAKEKLDLPRLQRYLRIGRYAINTLQNSISAIEQRINEEHSASASPGFQLLLNDLQMTSPDDMSHQNSSEIQKKTI